MSLNTGFFAAYNQRHKRTNVGYPLSLSTQQHQHISYLKSRRSSLVDSVNGRESFLPSITATDRGLDGRRPYRRNDFANNHLFVAKQKLARFFHNQPTMNIQSKSDLMHLFDQHQPKQTNRRLNINKRQENNSDAKSTPSLDQDVHLSVVNLTIKPSLPSSYTPLHAISHRRTQATNLQTRAPRSSIDWINPALFQPIHSTSRYSIEDELESNIIINELIDNNSDIINSTTNPLDSSVSYVKSILSPVGTEHC